MIRGTVAELLFAVPETFLMNAAACFKRFLNVSPRSENIRQHYEWTAYSPFPPDHPVPFTKFPLTIERTFYYPIPNDGDAVK